MSPVSTTWRSWRGRCCWAIKYGRVRRELLLIASGPNLAPGRKLQPESKGTPTRAMSSSRKCFFNWRSNSKHAWSTWKLCLCHEFCGRVQRASFRGSLLPATSTCTMPSSAESGRQTSPSMWYVFSPSLTTASISGCTGRSRRTASELACIVRISWSCGNRAKVAMPANRGRPDMATGPYGPFGNLILGIPPTSSVTSSSPFSGDGLGKSFPAQTSGFSLSTASGLHFHWGGIMWGCAWMVVGVQSNSSSLPAHRKQG